MRTGTRPAGQQHHSVSVLSFDGLDYARRPQIIQDCDSEAFVRRRHRTGQHWCHQTQAFLPKGLWDTRATTCCCAVSFRSGRFTKRPESNSGGWCGLGAPDLEPPSSKVLLTTPSNRVRVMDTPSTGELAIATHSIITFSNGPQSQIQPRTALGAAASLFQPGWPGSDTKGLPGFSTSGQRQSGQLGSKSCCTGLRALVRLLYL